MSLQEIKLALIRDILNTNNLAWLLRLQKLVREESKSSQPGNALLSLAREPTPDFIDVQRLKQSQQVDGKALVQGLRNRDHQVWQDENLDELMALV